MTTALALLLAGAIAGSSEQVVVADRGDLYSLAPEGSAKVRLTRTAEIESEPAFSPDGKQLAFVRGGRVYVARATGGGARPIGSGRSPAWAPGGKLALVRDGSILVEGKKVADGESPAWSRGGTLALVRDGQVFVGERNLGPGGEPAWTPDGRLAFVRDGQVVVGGEVVAEGTSPAWSPDGRRLAVVREGAVWIDGVRFADGIDPAWGIVAPREEEQPEPDPNELLPDLDQRAPSGLTISGTRLGFTSATDNVGRGPLWIRGSRPSTRVSTMTAIQRIVLRNGGTRVVPEVGLLRYTWSPDHTHWHLLRFQQFELRRASDFAVVVRDRKSGFCLADHYGSARHRVRGFTGPRFFGNCGQGAPGLLSVEQGTSIGFTDRYPAYFHGQNLELAGVPAGIYVLVHRANARGTIRELTLKNNAASLRLRLTWSGGSPRIRVLRACEGSERC